MDQSHENNNVPTSGHGQRRETSQDRPHKKMVNSARPSSSRKSTTLRNSNTCAVLDVETGAQQNITLESSSRVMTKTSTAVRPLSSRSRNEAQSRLDKMQTDKIAT